jgi:dienelactone hydrolase
MVQSHGSGGLKPEKQINKYGKSFLENGIGYFYIDHFAPRYAVSTVGNQAKVTGTSMTADVFKILETLSSHPKVDPKRIGIIGWSKGGGVALYSAMKPYRDGVLGSDMKFALHVALYPPCIFDWKMKPTGAPMRMILAEKETWTGLKGCISTAKRYKGQGLDVEAILLPGAYHGFDSWGERDAGVRDNKKAWGYGKCDLVGNEDGSITDRLSGLSYDSKTNRSKIYRGCAKKGVVRGGFDIKSAKTSLRLVTQFVTTNFGK